MFQLDMLYKNILHYLNKFQQNKLYIFMKTLNNIFQVYIVYKKKNSYLNNIFQLYIVYKKKNSYLNKFQLGIPNRKKNHYLKMFLQE